MTNTAFSKCVGESPAILEIKEEIARVARTDAKVLVTGESGTGKELVACAVHASSDRAAAPFVPVNCAGLPETLLESELFGYLRGSFTGAYRDKPGKLEVAHNGTVFLDEIGEMTLRMQGLLLRFLETGELQKVGGYGETRRVNTRLVTATNRNLRGLINQGQFREDLFHRINVIHLVVPPLRERKTDIPILFDHFMREFAAGRKRNEEGATAATHQPVAVRRLSPDALSALREYSWPGNVRELQNVVERLVVHGRSDAITVEELPADIRAVQKGAGRPARERRRTVADDLYRRIVHDGESFWSTVYPLFMDREITRSNVRDIIRKGLQDARGNYKIVARLFNMPSEDYKKFLNFLRKHNCQLSFKEYRENTGSIASRD